MTNTQRSTFIYSVAGLLLAISFIGMQLTKEINWTLFDFIIGGFLLFSAAFLLDFALRIFETKKQKIWMIIGILIVLFLVWAELAVGIFESPIAGS